MELISREDAKRKIIEELDSIDHVPNWVFRRLERVIDSLSTIEEQEEGEWTNAGVLTICCSNCKSQFHELEAMNFCPNCGAKMKSK